MDDGRDRYRPSPVNLFLIGLLLVAGAVLVKSQRWHSPQGEAPPAAELPAAVGPTDGEGIPDHLHTSPTVRVLLGSSRRPLEAAGEGYPGRVEVLEHDGRFYRVCHVDLETYVAHVVSSEVLNSWDLETKRAQAVAARSYAMTSLDPAAIFDLRASGLEQVFRGGRADGGAVDATRDTRGVALVQGEAVTRAYYHATCGGRTASVQDFWGMRAPRMRSVDCPWGVTAPLHRWSLEMDAAELATRLGGEVEAVWVETFDPGGRTLTVAVRAGGALRWMSGAEFREALGYTRIRSTWFTLEAGEGGYRFAGAGSGHGVGMCQWGARAMAQAGYGWREILGWYYPESTVDTVY